MSIERSYSLFNDNPRLELVLLENYSNEPFITADQPMINLAAKFKRLEAPLTFEVSWANIACLPSKNIIHSAKVASFARRTGEFGVHINNHSIDGEGVCNRKRMMVDALIDVQHKDYSSSGTELVMGTAWFIAPRMVEVKLNGGGIRTFRGKDVVIGTGTHASLRNTPRLPEVQPWTHIEALYAGVIPEKLQVFAGGLSQLFGTNSRTVALMRGQGGTTLLAVSFWIRGETTRRELPGPVVRPDRFRSPQAQSRDRMKTSKHHGFKESSWINPTNPWQRFALRWKAAH